jgi:tetratricopeptide (TPR) repeat protein
MNAVLSDDGLATYFTDAELIRSKFKALLAAPSLTKRVLILHGIGGVGKSSLMRMFRLQSKAEHIPAALASGDESKSVAAILADWAAELKEDGVNLAGFLQELQRYRALQTKAEDRLVESQTKLGSAAGKAVEGVASAAIGAVVGSLLPGIGTAVGALGGAGAEALIDWLRIQGFSKADIDLLLDADRRLTEKFLGALDEAAARGRIVLLLDTTEQLALIDDWICGMAQRLHPQVLLVLAGRDVPNWGRRWPGYLAVCSVEELRPMTEDVMRQLVYRYYSTLHGGEPDPRQVEAIVRFGRGLPIAVTTAVRLWIEYGVEDFDSIKAEVVADLIDRLKEGVSPEMSDLLEATASVRWFNKDILRAVAAAPDINGSYDELRRFPFVRPRAEGLALHDTVREIMNEYLFVHDPGRFQELHVRAAEYFRHEAAKRTGQDAQKLYLEQLYHLIAADEEGGMAVLREYADDLSQLRMVSRLKQLLTDVASYRHELEAPANVQWIAYYTANLNVIESNLQEAELVYERISADETLPRQLRGYALCKWGAILERGMRLQRPGGREKAVNTLTAALRLLPADDRKRFDVLVSFTGVHMRMLEYEAAPAYIAELHKFAEKKNDPYLRLLAWRQEKFLAAQSGNWPCMLKAHAACEKLLAELPQSNSLIDQIYGSWAIEWARMGRCRTAEEYGRKSEAALADLGVADRSALLRDIAYSLGMQRRLAEAEECIADSLANAHNLSYRQGEGISLGFLGMIQACNGQPDAAKTALLESLAVKQEVKDVAGVVEVLLYLGYTDELLGNLDAAEGWYRQCSALHSPRKHFDAPARAGLARILACGGRRQEAEQLLADVEHVAQLFEHNDTLASSRFTAAWMAVHAPAAGTEQVAQAVQVALPYLQGALIYALRFNRFQLDRILSDASVSCLGSVISLCTGLDKGTEMLTLLREWWSAGANTLPGDKPGVVSLTPQGLSLLEAEKLAREVEPGDGLPQKTVLQQIDAVLASRR